MPRYLISHRTSYQYSAPVVQSNHLLHLAPRHVPHQRVLRHTLQVDPLPAWRSDRTDYFGNPLTLLSVEEQHRTLSVHAVSEIEVETVGAPDFGATVPWRQISILEGADIPAEVAQFACSSQHARCAPVFASFAAPFFPAGQPVLEGARLLMSDIYARFRFDNSTTDVATPVEKVLEQRAGVCQDFAHLMISALRSLGLPARYVSGYILTYPPEGQPKLEGTDASHAWVSVWAPETGWVDFDPTNDLVNSDEHIAIAFGRDFNDVSPISGVLLGGGEHTVGVAVDVRPIEA